MVSAGVLGLLLATGVIVSKRSVPAWPTAVVARAPFRETLVESGAIGAARLMLYSSTIAGAQAKIVELAPEGAAVTAGALLVRFDSSVFEQTRARERAAFGQAQAELVRAREEFRIEELRARGDLDAAQQQVGSAESNLANQLEGRGKVDVAEAEAAAAEATREAGRLKTAFEDIKPMLAAGFVTRVELERAEQAWQRAEDQLRLAVMRREALITFERPAVTGRSKAEVNSAREGLTRQSETVASRLSQRQASVAVALSRLEEIRARLTILDDQIARTVVRADASGLVVYRDIYFGSDRRKPQVGDEVWPNQPLIALPDATQLVIDTRVREIDLHKIAASQHVSVTIDAYPGLRLPASVALVGALAQEDATRAGTKFFPVTVKLLSGDPRLRTGMTAQVEIEVASWPDALVVPAPSIFERDGAKYVIVARGDRTEPRTVSVLGANDSLAAVKGRVMPGERVLLIDPDTERR